MLFTEPEWQECVEPMVKALEHQLNPKEAPVVSALGNVAKTKAFTGRIFTFYMRKGTSSAGNQGRFKTFVPQCWR